MSVLLRAIPAFFVTFLFLAPPAVVAQEPGGIPVPLAEVSGGYMFMHDFSEEYIEGVKVGELDFPGGWYFSGAVNPTRWFGIVGEFAASYKNHFDVTAGPYQFNGESFGPYRFSNDARVYTFMGGPRFFRQFGRVVPFAQVLAGGANIRWKIRAPVDLGGETDKDDVTHFAIQPGGGVTVLLTEHVGLRVAGDFRSIIDFDEDADDEYTNEIRAIAGFTLHWGGR